MKPKHNHIIIPASVVRIVSGLFFALVIFWLGYSIYKNDLALPTKYSGLVHFHGQAVWVLSGSILCFVICMVSCLIVPMNQTFHRWTRNFGWVLFFAGIVVAIAGTKNKHTPQLSDFLIGCFCVLFFVALFITLVNLMVATIPDDWNLFAKHYPPPTRPIGNAYSNLYFNSRGQRVIFTDDGLYFYKIFLARPGHPPFLLPWASVKSIHKCRGFFRNSYIFKIKDDVAKLQLELPEIVEQELSKLQKESLVHK